MNWLPLSASDHELIAVASALIDSRFTPKRHLVAAAVRTSAGHVFTGIHLKSTVIDICAECVALGTALTVADEAIETVVALIKTNEYQRPTLISPCGTCRELILFYSRIACAIVQNGEVPAKCRIEELLPLPFTLSTVGARAC